MAVRDSKESPAPMTGPCPPIPFRTEVCIERREYGPVSWSCQESRGLLRDVGVVEAVEIFQGEVGMAHHLRQKRPPRGLATATGESVSVLKWPHRFAHSWSAFPAVLEVSGVVIVQQSVPLEFDVPWMAALSVVLRRQASPLMVDHLPSEAQPQPAPLLS